MQEGKRDQWGRDKERLEEERDPKVAWEHGVESVKVAGSSVIGGVQGAQESLEQGQEKAEGELKGRYYSVCRIVFFSGYLLNVGNRFGSVRSLILNIVRLSIRSSRFFKTVSMQRSILPILPRRTSLFRLSSKILPRNNTSRKGSPSFVPFSNASRVNLSNL